MYQRMDAPTTALRGYLPGGVRGTRATLTVMGRLAHQGATDPALRAAAADIVRARGVSGHDRAGQIAALHEWVRDHITFVGDVAGTETVQAPRVTLRLGIGDCDDLSTLLAALLLSIGIPADFRVIAANPARPRQF